MTMLLDGRLRDLATGSWEFRGVRPKRCSTSITSMATAVTGQSTIEEGRAAYQAWLKEHDRQTAEKAWEEGYIQAVKNMNPMPGEEPPEYTPNPYRKENA